MGHTLGQVAFVDKSRDDMRVFQIAIVYDEQKGRKKKHPLVRCA